MREPVIRRTTTPGISVFFGALDSAHQFAKPVVEDLKKGATEMLPLGVIAVLAEHSNGATSVGLTNRRDEILSAMGEAPYSADTARQVGSLLGQLVEDTVTWQMTTDKAQDRLDKAFEPNVLQKVAARVSPSKRRLRRHTEFFDAVDGISKE